MLKNRIRHYGTIWHSVLTACDNTRLDSMTFRLKKAIGRLKECRQLASSLVDRPSLIWSLKKKRTERSGTKIAAQNRSDHGGTLRARNHSAAEIAGFSASPAAKKSLAPSDFGVGLKIAGSSQRPRRKSPQPRDFAAAATTGH